MQAFATGPRTHPHDASTASQAGSAARVGLCVFMGRRTPRSAKFACAAALATLEIVVTWNARTKEDARTAHASVMKVGGMRISSNAVNE